MVAAAMRWGTYRGERKRPGFVMSIHGFIRISAAFRALTYLDERCLKAADVIIATSSREAQRLAARGHGHVLFVPNGIQHTRPPLGGCLSEHVGVDHGHVVAFIGRMSPEKRPDLVLSMASLLAADYPDMVFLLIGTGPMSKALPRLAARLGVAGQVRFAGLRYDAVQLLHEVDILVCPSDTEGTPRVVIEAMVAGVPVVATRVGGLPDLVTNGVTGILVEPGSAEALAAAVHTLITDPDTARALSEAATHAGRRFTVDRMERQVADAYAEAKRLAEAVT